MAKKKKIIKKTPTRVHSFRCTDKDWKELKKTRQGMWYQHWQVSR
jgi:hypothetical protein